MIGIKCDSLSIGTGEPPKPSLEDGEYIPLILKPKLFL